MTASQPIELSIDRNQILNALRLMTGILETSQVLPILGFIKLTLRQHNELTLTTTDGETKMSSQLNTLASNIETLDIAVPGKKFTDICKQLPNDGPITMAFSAPWVTIRQQDVSFKLQTLNTESFPDINIDEQNITTASIPERELQKLMQKTVFSMGQQDIRLYLNGVHMSINSDKISATATDGHRLSFQHTQQENRSQFEFIMPRKVVLELNKQLKQQTDELADIGYSNLLTIKTKDFTLTTSTLKGQYPDCTRFQEGIYEHSANINVEALKRALQRASILSHDKFKAVKITLSDNELIITAYNQEQENIHEKIALTYQGPNTTLGFNINYIMDILSNVASETIDIQFTEANKNVLFSEPNQKSQSSYIVMPLVV